MLQLASYDAASISTHTAFFHEHVSRTLGPHPRGTGPTTWQSFMTDDHTPVELSWCWSSTSPTPSVRYAVEAIGYPDLDQACTDDDPSSALLECTRDLAPGLDMLLAEHFTNTLTTSGSKRESGSGSGSESQIFLGFDLNKDKITVKQYFIPFQRSKKDNTTPLTTIMESLHTLPPQGRTLLQPLNKLTTFLSSPNQTQQEIQIQILATDNLPPTQSRIKLYLRNKTTTFPSVLNMLTLNNQIPLSAEMRATLKELWELVFGVLSVDSALGDGDMHPTAGMLYYYELGPGSVVPKSKVYLPVRHYARDDAQVARGLDAFLSRRGLGLGLGSRGYFEGVGELCEHRELESGLGFHTYISFACEGDRWNVTSYINPEVYHSSRDA
ncbi:aromatic prenyltransferase [Aspergillus avenaceus]|uniref:Aromatic prenyltransferase n=1 Tax=Aspergillus avenaceus TaxID=36643 RepID=A0A5N6TV55_ASPAV|nr:aromatic prenyltransferase [Aspergillus avenaceus]